MGCYAGGGNEGEERGAGSAKIRIPKTEIRTEGATGILNFENGNRGRRTRTRTRTRTKKEILTEGNEGNEGEEREKQKIRNLKAVFRCSGVFVKF